MFDEIELTIRPKLNENSQMMFLDQTSDVLASMDAKYPDMPIATKISLLESSRLFLRPNFDFRSISYFQQFIHVYKFTH